MANSLFSKSRVLLACPASRFGQAMMLPPRLYTRGPAAKYTARSISKIYAAISGQSSQRSVWHHGLLWQTKSNPGSNTAPFNRKLYTSRTYLEENKPPAPASPPAKTPLTQRLLARTSLPHENIWTVPNILTFSRLFAAPVIGYLLLHDQHLWAFSLFVYAGVTDLIDGYIARHWNQGTVVGTVIDPMADKTLMTIVTVTLAVNGAMPLYLAVLILGRDVLLAISAIYYRYISLPPPKTFARYWDFSLPSAEVRPTGISKINTALQLGLLGTTMGMPLVELGAWAQTALTGLQYTVALTTVWSGASYIYSKDAVKILTQEEIEVKQEEIRQKKEQ